MKLSSIFLPTLKETPSDEHKAERQLLIRAAMERKLSSGAGVRLPLGELQLDHIETVVKTELKTLLPQEVKLFNLPSQVSDTDAVTDLIKNELKSYKQLPKTLVTGREVLNIYSFDPVDGEMQGEKQLKLICQALERLSLKYKLTVDSEIYGLDMGNEDILYCTKCGYGRKRQWAETHLDITKDETQRELTREHTPNAGTIEELMSFYDTDGYAFAKSLLVGVGNEVVLAIVPGPKALSLEKLGRYLGEKQENLSLVDDELVREVTGAECGFAGPIGLKRQIKIYMDKRLAERTNLYVGANETDYHLGNVNYGRDFQAELVDCLIEVGEGDACPVCKARLEQIKGRLLAKTQDFGDNYNPKLYVEYLDNNGKSQRAKLTKGEVYQADIIEAIIAQNHDEKGIVYKGGQGAFESIILIVNMKNQEQIALAETLQEQLENKGLSVLVDDRDERAGLKFADAELIGITHQITVGKLAGENKVEYCKRGEDKQILDVEELIKAL